MFYFFIYIYIHIYIYTHIYIYGIILPTDFHIFSDFFRGVAQPPNSITDNYRLWNIHGQFLLSGLCLDPWILFQFFGGHMKPVMGSGVFSHM